MGDAPALATGTAVSASDACRSARRRRPPALPHCVKETQEEEEGPGGGGEGVGGVGGSDGRGEWREKGHSPPIKITGMAKHSELVGPCLGALESTRGLASPAGSLAAVLAGRQCSGRCSPVTLPHSPTRGPDRHRCGFAASAGRCRGHGHGHDQSVTATMAVIGPCLCSNRMRRWVRYRDPECRTCDWAASGTVTRAVTGTCPRPRSRTNQ